MGSEVSHFDEDVSFQSDLRAKNTNNIVFLQYRRAFKNGTLPSLQELQDFVKRFSIHLHICYTLNIPFHQWLKLGVGFICGLIAVLIIAQIALIDRMVLLKKNEKYVTGVERKKSPARTPPPVDDTELKCKVNFLEILKSPGDPLAEANESSLKASENSASETSSEKKKV